MQLKGWWPVPPRPNRIVPARVQRAAELHAWTACGRGSAASLPWKSRAYCPNRGARAA